MATVFFGEDIWGNNNIGLQAEIITLSEQVETVFDGVQTSYKTGLFCKTESYQNHVGGCDTDGGVFVTPSSEIADKAYGTKSRISIVRADSVQEACALLALGFTVKM